MDFKYSFPAVAAALNRNMRLKRQNEVSTEENIGHRQLEEEP